MTYHVLSGQNLDTASILNHLDQYMVALNQPPLYFTKNADDINMVSQEIQLAQLNGADASQAKVVDADNMSSNGVIHIIDQGLIPPLMSIAELSGLATAQSLYGDKITIDTTANTIIDAIEQTIANALRVKDIIANNGAVHVIVVLIMPTPQSYLMAVDNTHNIGLKIPIRHN